MAAPLSSDAAFRRVGNYATRQVGVETVVVPIRSSAADLDSVYTLNTVGAAIWADLTAARTADELADHLAGQFEVTAEAARADVARFIETLLAAGMIEEVAR